MDRARKARMPALALIVVLLVAALASFALLADSGPRLEVAAAPPSEVPAPMGASSEPAERSRALDATRTAEPRSTLAPDAADASQAAGAVGSAEPPRAGPAERAADESATSRLRGRVLDPAGAPVADARVQVQRWDTDAPAVWLEVRSDGQGAFALELPAGGGMVWAEGDGFASSEPRRLRVRAGETVELEALRLRPACALRGVVRDAQGAPVAGAEVRLGRNGSLATPSTTADAEGEFSFDGIPEGLHGVRVTAPGFVEETRRGVPVVSGGSPALELVLERAGELSGFVRAVDGLPTGDAWIFVQRRGEPLTRVQVGAEGRYRIRGLPPGDVELFARSPTYDLTCRAAVAVVAGALTPLDLVLEHGPVIEGVLRDAAGEPLAGLEVRARSGEVQRSGESAADGSYRVKELYPGRYRLSVSRGEGPPLVEVEVEVAAGAVTRDLVVPAGARVSGRVVGADGAPVPGANVFAIVGEDYMEQTRSDEQGRFVLRDLPAAEYELFVRVDEDRLVGIRPLSLREGQQVEGLEVLARAPARLLGRVHTQDGAPLAGVGLRVRGVSAPVVRRAQSAEDGTFELGPLYDGAYVLEADAGSLELLAAKLKVAAVRVEPVRFTIEAGREARVELIATLEPFR